MLHAFYRFRALVILLCVNLLCDIVVTISVHSQASLLKLAELTAILFQKFYCSEIGIIELAVFLSLVGVLIFFCINALHSDNQKYGLFVLTRTSRLKYTVLRTCSILLYIISAVLLSAVFMFIVHRAAGLWIPFSYYLKFLCIYFFIVSVCVFAACITHCISKSASLAYSCGIVIAFLICILTAKQFAANDISVLPQSFAAASCILAAVFFILTVKGDFLAAKIKE